MTLLSGKGHVLAKCGREGLAEPTANIADIPPGACAHSDPKQRASQHHWSCQRHTNAPFQKWQLLSLAGCTEQRTFEQKSPPLGSLVSVWPRVASGHRFARKSKQQSARGIMFLFLRGSVWSLLCRPFRSNHGRGRDQYRGKEIHQNNSGWW